MRYFVSCVDCAKPIERDSSKRASARPPLCKPCQSARAAARSGAKSARKQRDTSIDWLAVYTIAVERKPMPLTTYGEKVAAIRMVWHRLIRAGENTVDVPPGKITSRQLGELMGVERDTITSYTSRLPKADRSKCPDCGEPMWVRDNGYVEPHPNRFLDQCPTSGATLEDKTA